MPIQVGYTFTTDLVTKRTHNKIMRDVNRSVGEHIVATILPKKFNKQAFAEYPATFYRRTRGWRKRKRAKVGHNIPNVLTGRMKRHILGPGHKVRATRNGGRVYISNYFKMPESQRQEMEVLNSRDRRRLARHAEREYTAAVNDPQNQRKRRVKGS